MITSRLSYNNHHFKYLKSKSNSFVMPNLESLIQDKIQYYCNYTIVYAL